MDKCAREEFVQDRSLPLGGNSALNRMLNLAAQELATEIHNQYGFYTWAEPATDGMRIAVMVAPSAFPGYLLTVKTTLNPNVFWGNPVEAACAVLQGLIRKAVSDRLQQQIWEGK